MKRLLSCFILGLSLHHASYAASQSMASHIITSVGWQTCGVYLNTEDKKLKYFIQNWVQGNITAEDAAMSTILKRKLLYKTIPSTEKVMETLDIVCRKSPDITIAKAAAEIYNRLLPF